MFTTLIDASALAQYRANPEWAVIDCRFDLARPQWGADAYAAGHIPGALYAHLDHDLSSAVTPQSEYTTYQRTFNDILRSLRLNGRY